MDEYIKREDALKIIDNYSKAVTEEGMVVVNAIRDIVAIITPTADVVPKSEVSDAIDTIIQMIDLDLSAISNILNAKGVRAGGKTVLLSKWEALMHLKKGIAEIKKKYT